MTVLFVLPMAFYVFYVWCLAILNFRTRLAAIKNGEMKGEFFKSFQGTASERVITVGRHYDNQFQLPMFCICLAVYRYSALVFLYSLGLEQSFATSRRFCHRLVLCLFDVDQPLLPRARAVCLAE